MAKKKTRKKRTKKQQAQDERLMYLGIGFVFIIIGLLAIFKLGFLGILIANVLRFLVVNAFPAKAQPKAAADILACWYIHFFYRFTARILRSTCINHKR